MSVRLPAPVHSLDGVELQPFVAERFWPDATVKQVAAASVQLRAACARLRAGGARVRYAGVEFGRRDRTLRCRYETDVALVVWAIHAVADISADRVAADVDIA